MINWLTNCVGTGPYLDVVKEVDESFIVDVRDLVDKDGNTSESILEKVEQGINLLRTCGKVVVCCDYGMSRSNSIAIAIISKFQTIPFSEATRLALSKVSSEGIKPEVLHKVYEAVVKADKFNEGSRRVLVTGASGFLGKSLISQIGNDFFAKGITGKDCDLKTDAITLDLLVRENQVNTVVHLANPRVYTINTAMGETLTMLKNVLEICRLNKLRFIFVSSWEVYSGYVGDSLVVDESTPLFPKGAYAETKWMCEKLILHYANMYGLKYCIVRSTPVYGEGSDKPKFIYNFINKALKNEDITTHEYLNGSPRLDLLFSGDLVNAITEVLKQDVYGTLNIGSGKHISTQEIAKLIVSVLGSSSSINSNKINSTYPGIVFNNTKAKATLKWTPKTTFESFIREKFKSEHR